MKNLKNVLTGLNDSNGKPIVSGDNIRYEYLFGFNKEIIDGKEIEMRCFPYKEVKNTFHEKVMEYQILNDCAGFFIDKPKGMTILQDSIKYYVV